MGKTGLTYIVGINGGIKGVRIVRAEGIILWLRERYQSDRLLPYIGHEVIVEDDIEKLMISEGGFDCKNRMIQGKWICTIFLPN